MSNFDTSNLQPPSGTPEKKKSALMWVLIGCSGLLLVGVIVVVIGGLFVYNKAKEAGLDPELMEKNPAMATAKLIAAINPDIEIVSVDDDKGLITFRKKTTGKTVTVNLDDAMDGKIEFSDGKEVVTIDANNGENGNVEIKSDKGSIKVGQGSSEDLPDWFPEYPGSTPEGTYSVQSPTGNSTSFRFLTKDSVELVSGFYENQLGDASFKVTASRTRQGGSVAGSVLTAKNRGNGRTAVITVVRSEGSTQVMVNLVEEK